MKLHRVLAKASKKAKKAERTWQKGKENTEEDASIESEEASRRDSRSLRGEQVPLGACTGIERSWVLAREV